MKQQATKNSSLTKKQQFCQLVDSHTDLTIPEVRELLGTNLQYLQRMAKELYGKKLSELFTRTKPIKYVHLIDKIEWELLSNQEIAEEYGIRVDYVCHLRTRYDKPQPAHFQLFKPNSKQPVHNYRSLLEIIDFYQWWKDNSPIPEGRSERKRTFTVSDVRKFFKRDMTFREMRRGWRRNKWVRLHKKRAPGVPTSQWTFTDKLYKDAEEIGVYLQML